MFQYLYALVIPCNAGKVSIFELKCYNSAALGHVRQSILSRYFLLECLNKTDNSFHAWVI